MGYPIRIAAAVSLTLIQIGEFSFVLDRAGRAVGISPVGWGTTGEQTTQFPVGDPTNAQDAATKNYVDSTAQGLDPKGSVRVATQSNLSLSSPGSTIWRIHWWKLCSAAVTGRARISGSS